MPNPKEWTQGFAKLYKERRNIQYMAQIANLKNEQFFHERKINNEKKH